MATIDQCRTALVALTARLASTDSARSKAHAFDRTISCRVPDLDVTFSGNLSDGHVTDLTTEPAPKAQIRFTAASDDLVAIAEGQLDLASAWKSGRLKVQAGVMDLLKLRSMF